MLNIVKFINNCDVGLLKGGLVKRVKGSFIVFGFLLLCAFLLLFNIEQNLPDIVVGTALVICHQLSPATEDVSGLGERF